MLTINDRYFVVPQDYLHYYTIPLGLTVVRWPRGEATYIICDLAARQMHSLNSYEEEDIS